VTALAAIALFAIFDLVLTLSNATSALFGPGDRSVLLIQFGAKALVAIVIVSYVLVTWERRRARR